MDRRIAVLLMIAALLAPGSGRASGPYIEASLGVSIPSDSDVRVAPLDVSVATSEFDRALVVGGALGLRLAWFRVAADVSYREASVDKLRLLGIVPLPGAADVSVITPMANAFVDLPLAKFFKPYVGGGIGVSAVSVDSKPIALTGIFVDDSETRFAWNLLGGLGLYLGDHIVIDLGYRYLDAGDASLTAFAPSLSALPATIETDFTAHEIRAGLRLGF